MIYINQISWLNKYSLEDNKKFLKSIYEEENFIEVNKFFNFLDCNISWRRQTDKEMSLEKFLELMKNNDYITLQLASPDPDEIRYGVVSKKINSNEKFLSIDMPYNNSNFDLISKIYKDSFNKDLESEEVQDGLVDYYKKRITPGYFKF